MIPPAYSKIMVSTGGRRFLLSCASLVSITFLNAYGTLSGDAFAIALTATVASYIAGGTYQHVATSKKASNEPSQPE